MSGLRIPVYQVDAFTSRVFAGNPAAVFPLKKWLPDEQMQSIASEMNLANTAFFVPNQNGYDLRWFTPTVEVPLCGHATLASACIIFHDLAPAAQSIRFETKSGALIVTRDGDLLSLDFPSRPPSEYEMVPELIAALGSQPEAVLNSRDFMAVYASEDEVRTLKPNLEKIAQLDRFGVIVTAPGKQVDFVSRFFAPAQGVPEDPVTGSAHCTLIPYWSKRLGKKKLHAQQVSTRGGELWCEDRGERVTISGKAVRFLEGSIYL
jgi:PhzF family phenazine biosynthesis protein